MENERTPFYESLMSAHRLGVPIQLGRLRDRSLRGGRATDAKLKLLEQATTSVNNLHDKLPRQYEAALAAFDSGVPLPTVLDGLSVRAACKQRLAHLLRSSLTYLLVLFSFAAFGVWFFRDLITPSFAFLRNDLKLTPVIDAPPLPDTTSWQTALLVTMLIGILVTVILRFCCGRYSLVYWLGGSRYEKFKTAATAAAAAAAMVGSGMNKADAVLVALDLVDAKADEQKRIELVSERISEDSASASFLAIAENLRSAAEDHFALLKVALPMLVLFGIGGVAVLLYCMALFMPLVVLIRDLSLPSSL